MSAIKKRFSQWSLAKPLQLLAKPLHKPLPKLLFSLLALLLIACQPGSSDSLSDSGDQEDLPPVAAATVLNFSTTIDADIVEVRSGTQVIVTAKDSDGIDDPLISFSWSVVNTDTVPEQTIDFTLNATNVIAFMAPETKVDQELAVNLTVLDSDGVSNAKTLTVKVIGVLDTNNYLVQAVSSEESFYLEIPSSASGSYDLSITPVATWQNLSGDALDSSNYNGDTLDLSGIFSFTPRMSQPFDPAEPIRIKFAVPLLDHDEINNNAGLAFSDRLELEKIGLADLSLTFEYSGSVPSISILDASMNPIATITNGVALTRSVTELRDLLGYESRSSANAYYDCIDPGETDLSLNDWLAERNMNPIGRIDPGPDFAHAIYVNNYDLGFGRNMYMRHDTVNNNVYAYVVNHPSLQATVSRAGAFAVVAMDYSDHIDCSNSSTDASNKTVKFYAFVPDQANGGFTRASTMNFDGRGERALPGACTACHAGESHDLTFMAADASDLNATFMPWDLDSFLYTSASDTLVDSTYNSENVDPDSTARYTRAAQETEFRELNQISLDTYLNEYEEAVMSSVCDMGHMDFNAVACDNRINRHKAPVELVNGWYGNNNCDLTDINFDPLNCDTLAGNFNGDYVQPGWIGQQDLYHNVYARNCRMCHTQLEWYSKSFDSYQAFIDNTSNIIKFAYEEGRMPLARLTADRFWLDPVESNGTIVASSAADFLKTHLTDIDSNLDIGVPGQPAPRIANITNQPDAGQSTSGHGVALTLDGSNSIFADTFSWSVFDSNCNNTQTITDSSELVASLQTDIDKDQVKMIDPQDGSPSPSPISCWVDVRLSATDSESMLTRSSTQRIQLDDRVPSADCFDGTVGSIDLLNGAQAGDGMLSIEDFDTAGSQGLGAISAGPGANEVTYALNDSNTIGIETFTYRLQDANNTLSTTGSNCSSPGSDARSVITVDSVSAATPQMNLNADAATTSSLDVSWSGFTGATYALFRNGSQIGTGLNTTSFSDTGLPTSNTFYNYTVQATISGNPTSVSSPQSYRTLISYDDNIVPDIVTAVGCLGCHSAGSTRTRLEASSCLTDDLDLSDCDSAMNQTITSAQRQLILDWRSDGVPD